MNADFNDERDEMVFNFYDYRHCLHEAVTKYIVYNIMRVFTMLVHYIIKV